MALPQTNPVPSAVAQFDALIAAGLLQRREPAWLRALRSSAQARLNTAGLPGKRQESWHYSAADLWLQQYSETTALAPITPDEHANQINEELPPGHVLRFNHGYLIDQQIGTDERDKILLQPLAQLDPSVYGEFLQWLQAQTHADTLPDLVTALAPEPWLLIIKAGAKVERPLLLSHLSCAPGSQIGQLYVWVQVGATATVVESFAAGASAGQYLNINHSTLKLDADSQLTYARLNRDGALGQHLGSIEAQLGRSARLHLQALESGGDGILRNRIRNGFHITLQEPGAEFIGRAAFAARAHQHIDYHFTIDHKSDHGRCDLQVQGLAAERSRGVVNGRIYIAPNTRGNDGHFLSHNLLLSSDAEIDAKPELEICADEVSCAHGATIGQLDEDQLLYLQTRGIGRSAAIALLTEGFLKAGLLDCKDDDLNGYLQQQLLASLQAAGRSHS